MEIFKQIAHEKNINIPNGLTGTRLAISSAISAIILIDGPWIIPGALLWAGYLTDMLDGVSARVLHQETKLWKYLDPVVDFFSFHMILWAMWVHSDSVAEKMMYFWISFLNLIRDKEVFKDAFSKIKNGGDFDVCNLWKVKTRFNMWWITSLVALGDTVSGSQTGIWLLWVWVWLSVASLLEYKKNPKI